MVKKYVVTAQVCDIIRSVPVDRKQAQKMSKMTKAKIPKATVKVKKA